MFHTAISMYIAWKRLPECIDRLSMMTVSATSMLQPTIHVKVSVQSWLTTKIGVPVPE